MSGNFEIIGNFTREKCGSCNCGDFCLNVPGHENVGVTREVFHGGKSDGLETVTIYNDTISVLVIPTRGMGIGEVRILKEDGEDVRFGWNSPVTEWVNPRNVPLNQADGLGWLRGFNEFVARCGLEWTGAPEFNENGTLRYSLHGLIENTPAAGVLLEVDEDAQVLKLTGVMNEGRLFFNHLELTSTVTVPFSGNWFQVDDCVKNLAARDAEFELLYHCNTGNPIADQGSKIYIPFVRCVPRNDFAASQLDELFDYHEPRVGEPETCYYYDLSADADGNTATFLRDPTGEYGVGLSFNKREFPYFCQWKCQHAREDGYVTGMEPCTSFPNNHSFERECGRVIDLKPGENRHHGIRFTFACNPEQAAQQIARVEQLQALCPEPVVERKMAADWAN